MPGSFWPRTWTPAGAVVEDRLGPAVIDELEALFSGAGWRVIKLAWGSDWDGLFARDTEGALARVFKAIGEPVRLRLLSLIASHAGGEACVCDLTGAFELSGPTISHHLKVLREAGVIDGERRGTWIYYRVRPDTLRLVSDALAPAEAPAVSA